MDTWLMSMEGKNNLKTRLTEITRNKCRHCEIRKWCFATDTTDYDPCFIVKEILKAMGIELEGVKLMSEQETTEEKNKVAYEVIDSLKQLRDHLKKGELNVK